MFKFNEAFKSILSFIAVLVLSLFALYAIVNLTKAYTTTKNVLYASWDYFIVTDISLIDNKLHYTLKASDSKLIKLISDEKCPITEKAISTINNKKVSFEMKNIEVKNIFFTKYDKQFYFPDSVRNVFCKEGYSMVFRK